MTLAEVAAEKHREKALEFSAPVKREGWATSYESGVCFDPLPAEFKSWWGRQGKKRGEAAARRAWEAALEAEAKLGR